MWRRVWRDGAQHELGCARHIIVSLVSEARAGEVMICLIAEAPLELHDRDVWGACTQICLAALNNGLLIPASSWFASCSQRAL